MHARAILSFNRENQNMLNMLNIGGAVCLILWGENGEVKYELALEGEDQQGVSLGVFSPVRATAQYYIAEFVD